MTIQSSASSSAPISSTERIVEDHEKYMREALVLAEEALAVGEVPVGCVFVGPSGEILGRGRNYTNELLNATQHAEIVSIDEILRHYPAEIFQETTLYVTVEPCIMCAAALRHLKIKRIVFGCGNDRFGGCGSVLDVNSTTLITETPPYETVSWIMGEEAVILLRRFYLQENERAPQPKKKTGRTLKTTVQVANRDTLG